MSDTVYDVQAFSSKNLTVNIAYKWIRLYIQNTDAVSSTSDLLQVFVYGITSPPSILPSLEQLIQNGSLKTITSATQRNTSKQILSSYVFDHGYSGFPLSYPPACPYYYCPPLGSAPILADPFPANPTIGQRAKSPYDDIFFYVAYPEGYVPPIIDHQTFTGGPRIVGFQPGLENKSQAQSYTKLNYNAPLPGNPPILERKPYISFEQASNAITFQERLNGNTDGPDYDMNRVTVMTGMPFHHSSASGRVGCYFTATYNQTEKDVGRTVVTQMLVGMGDFMDNPLRPLNNIPELTPPHLTSIQNGIAWFNNQSPGDSSHVYLFDDPFADVRRIIPGQTSGAAFGYYSNVATDQPLKDFHVHLAPGIPALPNHKVHFNSGNPAVSFGIAVWNASSARFYLTTSWKFDRADGNGTLPLTNFLSKNSYQIEYDPATETYFFYIQNPTSTDEDNFVLVHSVSDLPPSTCNFAPLSTFGHYNSFESWDNGTSSLALHNYTTYRTHPDSASDADAFKRSLYTVSQYIPSIQSIAGADYTNPVPLLALLPDPSGAFYPPVYETNINDITKNIEPIQPKTVSRPISIVAVSFSCTVANTTILVRIMGRKRWNYNVLLHPAEPYKGDGVPQYTVSNKQAWKTSLPIRLLVADGRHLTFTQNNAQSPNIAASDEIVYGEFLLAQGFHSVLKTMQELTGQPSLQLDPRLDTISVEFACPQTETLSSVKIGVNILY